MIDHTIAWNLFDVINVIILKFPVALKFPTDDLQFPADVAWSHFGTTHTILCHCELTNFTKDILPSTAIY